MDRAGLVVQAEALVAKTTELVRLARSSTDHAHLDAIHRVVMAGNETIAQLFVNDLGLEAVVMPMPEVY